MAPKIRRHLGIAHLSISDRIDRLTAEPAQRENRSGVKVLIAGGGIAGLGAAISLRQAGHRVQVLERASVPGEVGAGLALWPNGRRALASLGVDDLDEAPVRSLKLSTWRGRLLSEPPLDQLERRYGFGMTLVHRAELHGRLLETLGPDRVRFGTEVVGFEQTGDRVTVALGGGQAMQADLLVGADGIRSAVRRDSLRDGEPRYSGASCWRGVTGFELEAAKSFNWWGPGGEFGAFPLSKQRVYWFGVQNRPANDADSSSGLKADLMRTFSGWPELVTEVVEATDESSIVRNNLYDRPPVRSWSRGRVTLVGDAAHPMLPNSAQGACQALEDAVALGEALRSGDVREGLERYERRRIPIANRLVVQSRRTAGMIQSTNLIATAIRDRLVALLPSSTLVRQLDSLMR
jgi:2-polyprenyl-6-methoxyphenol hydroxylase-like FAD-dependent oxidoreductase